MHRQAKRLQREGIPKVDKYSGYNRVCTPAGWTRVVCLAHLRCYFFNAQETAPEAAQEALQAPKSPMGKAINDALSTWSTLLVYLDHPELRPDNNAAERALRVVALGRKNFLFVGKDAAGENLAILQPLVATCVMHQVDPQTYLADVLIRMQTHPASRIRELLPDQWRKYFSG